MQKQRSAGVDTLALRMTALGLWPQSRPVRWRLGAVTLLMTGCWASLAWAAPATTIIATRNAGLLDMVGRADPVVKSVMLLLLAASVTTWALWLSKTLELTAAKTILGGDIDRLQRAQSLEQVENLRYRAAAEMIEVATTELKRAGATPSHRTLEGVAERVAVQLPIVETRAIHRVLRGTNLLASIGATAPFVGLAGTVWGIMNSFLGIAGSHSTSLAVVAPGIAEALLATAVGLAAAIPAVLIYNILARAISGYRRLLGEASVLTTCVLSREAERRDESRPFSEKL